MKKTFTLTISILLSILSSACLYTYQFKTFPVGSIEDDIISIDVQIIRTEEYSGKKSLGIDIDDSLQNNRNEMFILKSFVSVYNSNQKLKTKNLIDSTYIVSNNYSDSLLSQYHRGLKKVKEKYNNIKYFNPDYISYCDFQKKCHLTSIRTDTSLHKDYIYWKGKEYLLEQTKDSTYYAFEHFYYKYPHSAYPYFISSVRTYSNSKFEILVTHLETGHEVQMGWIRMDGRTKNERGENAIVPKESTPEINFNNLGEAVYHEPLLHHAYGFDAFVTIIK